MDIQRDSVACELHHDKRVWLPTQRAHRVRLVHHNAAKVLRLRHVHRDFHLFVASQCRGDVPSGKLAGSLEQVSLVDSAS